MTPLTDEEIEYYEKQNVCHICQKEFCYNKNEKNKFKLYQKVRDHCHYTGKLRGPAHSICNLRYKVQLEIPVIIECLGENTEKYITFSVSIKKENFDDNKIITYTLKFIDSCRFMQSTLSDLADNLSEINNKDCKKCMERKKIRSECEFIGLKDKCKECNDISAKSIDELIKKFPRTYKFCNGNLNKFVLLLRKGVYPYEYMHSWDRFNETLPPKKSFYSKLNLEDISDKDYFYVQTDTLLLADVYKKFRDKCIEIYGLDPSHFLSAPGLAWQACLKKQM